MLAIDSKHKNVIHCVAKQSMNIEQIQPALWLESFMVRLARVQVARRHWPGLPAEGQGRNFHLLDGACLALGWLGPIGVQCCLGPAYQLEAGPAAENIHLCSLLHGCFLQFAE